MKTGITVIEKRKVGDAEGGLRQRWVWLCEESLPGQGCREWATYVSTSPDETQTEYGNYFVRYSNAVADFEARLTQYSKNNN